MAEPARKPQLRESTTPDRWDGEEELSGSVVQRWVKRPDGRMEFVELPLTPEIFLDPQEGDKFIQGEFHGDTVISLWERLRRRLTADDTATVLFDVKHLLGLGPGLGPSPDVSVIHGVRPRRPGRDEERHSVDLLQERVVPSLIIEVINLRDPALRKVDEVDKVELYARVGIREYLLVNLPRPANGNRYELRGLRLSSERRYRPVRPDSQGRILSETTGLLFGVSSDGWQIDIFDAATGERLLTPEEEAERAQQAEQRAQASEQKAQEAEQKAREEATARASAESELARLRAEIERLKGSA